jgi:glycosyltransferase involved in cell wall biosynthesis
MKILFLDQFNQPGGAQQCLLDLLPAVLQRGWEPVVMLPGVGEVGDRIRKLGIRVEPVRCGPYSSGHKTWADVTRFAPDILSAAADISKHHADLIYVNGPRLIPASVLAARNRTPLLFHCHSYLSPRYLEWITALPLRLARARVAASSRFVTAPLRKWLPSSRIQVVYNGVAADGRIRRTRTKSLRIGVIGRIAPEKGQVAFLNAANILHHHIPGCNFVVCGAPLFSDITYDRNIRALAKELPVEFTGWREDVGEILNTLDLLVVPSSQIDATPRIILQAFAARVPVVAFANEGFKELIDDGETGFLVTTRTPEALAAKLRDLLLGSPDVLNQVAENAWTTWRTRFSLEAYRDRLIGILETMV